MCKFASKPSRNENNMVNSSIGTYGEVVLLLQVTMEYKNARAIQNVDWD